jgi:RNA polymerase sigma factor (sigma-70 family)
VEELADEVRRAGAGDLEAYGRIVRSFQDMAVGYAYSLIGDFHLAEDAAQNAFVAAFRDLPQLRRPEAFPGWFRRVVLKHADRLRRSRRATVPLEAATLAGAGEHDPVHVVERREMHDRALAAVQELPQPEREVTALHFIDGYSSAQIGRFLEVPASTVRGRLQSAKQHLRERMVAMVKEEMGEHRPSRDDALAARVQAALGAAGHGRAEELGALLTESPELVEAEGAHPYGWGYDVGPLHMAVQWDQAEKIEMLLDHGADVEAVDGSGMRPLHLALIYRCPGAARLLVERGAAVDVWAAAGLGDAARVRALLEDAPELANSADGYQGTTPLHWAATAEVARLLLERGADPAVPDAHGNSPARWAAGYCAVRPGVAEFLMAETGESDVFMACALGRMDAVRDFLDADPDLLRASIGPRDVLSCAFFYSDFTPLHVAAFHGRAGVAALLLERGAHVAGTPCDGFRPLHAAAAFGNVETVQVLLDAGADLQVEDNVHHGTARAWAEFWRNPETLEFLTARGGKGSVPGR